MTPEHIRAAQVVHQILSSKVKAAQKDIGDETAYYDSNLTHLAEQLAGGKIGKPEFRREHKSLIKSSGEATFRAGWEEGGGDIEDTETDDLDLLSDWISEQQGHVNDFSDWLGDKEQDHSSLDDRVSAWVASLKNLGEQAKVRAQGNPRLLFDGKDGDESCDECTEYTGQIHPLSWWEKRGLLKRNGNDNFTCGRFDKCHHHFYDPKTGKMVIE